MRFIHCDNQLKTDWRIKIVIVSAKGKEQFYEKLGFEIFILPNSLSYTHPMHKIQEFRKVVYLN